MSAPSVSSQDVHDIEETVIKTQNGTPIRVKDIATVIAGPEDPAGAESARRFTGWMAK